MQECSEGGGRPVQPWRILRANKDCSRLPFTPFSILSFIILWNKVSKFYFQCFAFLINSNRLKLYNSIKSGQKKQAKKFREVLRLIMAPAPQHCSSSSTHFPLTDASTTAHIYNSAYSVNNIHTLVPYSELKIVVFLIYFFRTIFCSLS